MVGIYLLLKKKSFVSLSWSFSLNASFFDGYPTDTEELLFLRFDSTTVKEVMDVIAKMRNLAPAASDDEIFLSLVA